jgi:quercetin dioxygenase-like cupin family protein
MLAPFETGGLMRTLLLAPLILAAASAAFADGPTVTPLLKKDLIPTPDSEVTMLTVEYPPGGSSPSHRHNGQVFVYVLSGTLEMQVEGKPSVTLKPGDSFYEAPEDVHAVSRNASTREPAKFVVVLITPKK